jgi:hypothetical protein
MRDKLKPMENARSRFTGVFVRYGHKAAYKGPPITTLLFREVKNQLGEVVTDHIWFTMTKGFEQCDLEEGDVVSFDARVKEYWKGYRGHREDVYSTVTKDYKLSHPNNIRSSKPSQGNNPTLF